jgi:signal peptidase II
MHFVAFCVGFFVFLADCLSKFLTYHHLPLMHGSWYPYGGIGIFKNFLGIEFSISHQINRGAAWGILAEYQVSLLYLRIVLILALLIYLLFFNKNRSWEIPFALILAGAFGNVLDYFLYGHVVDMLHFILWGYDFPVFNLADTAIFIGISWLFIISSCATSPQTEK